MQKCQLKELVFEVKKEIFHKNFILRKRSQFTYKFQYVLDEAKRGQRRYENRAVLFYFCPLLCNANFNLLIFQ